MNLLHSVPEDCLFVLFCFRVPFSLESSAWSCSMSQKGAKEACWEGGGSYCLQAEWEDNIPSGICVPS